MPSFTVDLDLENLNMRAKYHDQGGSNMEYELNSEIKETIKKYLHFNFQFRVA